MSSFSDTLPLFWNNLGVAVGFLLSLFLFSFIVRDNFLSRLAQYLLVGASLGYGAVLAWRNVLWPRLFVPLLIQIRGGDVAAFFAANAPTFSTMTWMPLLLGLLLWIAGVDYLRYPPPREAGGYRAWVRFLGVLPVALMAGTGLGVGVAGAIQGTLVPQFRRAAQIGFLPSASLNLLLVGLLTLLISGGALVHLQIGEETDPARRLPWLVQSWRWIGQRALWLAAGVIFARLVMARFSLLIARFDYFFFGVRETTLWHWLQSITQGRLL